ncbi:hypothetical protein BD410DRAFT_746724 [Rickenella mellea]|uniref:Uncharacterized protein n=1 Tax=Rickenella mellea TaxID=50990 RepID=A0A4Y7Q860_9AGAM|nr:hypothetical protein BD410DRAFT_746724 [Rickenella mellea]
MSTEHRQSNSGGNKPASKRWTHFYSALQLAIQRTAHKWTYEDFAECFAKYCKDDPDQAKVNFQMVSDYQENRTTTLCEELFTRYNAQENIDILHEVVMEARARRQAGEQPGNDVWRPDLDPRTAVRARTVPILRQTRDTLKTQLAELEKENLQLQKTMMDNVKATKDLDEEESKRLDLLDEIEAEWDKLPIEDIQEWTLRAAETMKSTV